MKKFLTMAALIVMAAMCLTSCGSDDDEPAQASTTATYKMTFSQDVIDNFDVILVYKGNNGQNIPVTVSGTEWTKSASCSKLPADFGVKYIFTLKEGVELVKDKYDLDVLFNIEINKGSTHFKQDIVVCKSVGTKKDKVLDQMNRLSGQSCGFTVGKDGSILPNSYLKFDY